MRAAVFFSGHGSTLQALLDSSSGSSVCLGVTPRTRVPGIFRLRQRGIPVLESGNWSDILHRLRGMRITSLWLLGFMKIVPEAFLQDWGSEIFNLHPSLLPLHPGLHGIEKSLKAGSPLGASLHRVNSRLDGGPLLRQRKASSGHFQGDFAEARVRVSSVEQHLIRELACRM
ncbi:MAG: formyltransferase family protein [Bdellovibrio sp.]